MDIDDPTQYAFNIHQSITNRGESYIIAGSGVLKVSAQHNEEDQTNPTANIEALMDL